MSALSVTPQGSYQLRVNAGRYSKGSETLLAVEIAKTNIGLRNMRLKVRPHPAEKGLIQGGIRRHLHLHLFD